MGSGSSMPEKLRFQLPEYLPVFQPTNVQAHASIDIIPRNQARSRVSMKFQDMREKALQNFDFRGRKVYAVQGVMCDKTPAYLTYLKHPDSDDHLSQEGAGRRYIASFARTVEPLCFVECVTFIFIIPIYKCITPDGLHTLFAAIPCSQDELAIILHPMREAPQRQYLILNVKSGRLTRPDPAAPPPVRPYTLIRGRGRWRSRAGEGDDQVLVTALADVVDRAAKLRNLALVLRSLARFMPPPVKMGKHVAGSVTHSIAKGSAATNWDTRKMAFAVLEAQLAGSFSNTIREAAKNPMMIKHVSNEQGILNPLYLAKILYRMEPMGIQDNLGLMTVMPQVKLIDVLYRAPRLKVDVVDNDQDMNGLHQAVGI